MKLSEFAKQKGVTYRTAWNWFNKDLIPGAYKMSTGTIIVPSSTESTSKDLVSLLLKSHNKEEINNLIQDLKNANS